MDAAGIAGRATHVRAGCNAVKPVAGQPLAAADARRIAEAFLPRVPFGNRYDYYYVRAKLGSDPLYPGVVSALHGSVAPLLDLGCGLGLLVHVLRADGQQMPYHGVDNDAAKIARAQRAAAKGALTQTQFEVVDLARVTPQHRGSVAILDVLQYLDVEAQLALLANAAAMLTPGAVLVIRSAIDDDTGRARTSRVTDRLANWIGWMQFRPRSYPTLARLRDALQTAGLQAEFTPLYGNTPFNNWLIIAKRVES